MTLHANVPDEGTVRDRQDTAALVAAGVRLRPLRSSDAIPLVARLSSARVCQYIAPPPGTVEGFRRYVRWAQRRRRYFCLGIVPGGMHEPVGLIQLWGIGSGFDCAEWGFVLDERYWGTGLFVRSAQLMLDFAFNELRVHRLEARAAVANGRGNGVLAKLGFSTEGVLRRNFAVGGEYVDHALWSMLASEWAAARANHGSGVTGDVGISRH